MEIRTLIKYTLISCFFHNSGDCLKPEIALPAWARAMSDRAYELLFCLKRSNAEAIAG